MGTRADGSATLSHPFTGGGEMGARMAAHRWEDTPLGAVRTWSEALCTAVAAVLRSRYPMSLCWGDDLVMLYNDAHVPILGGKHPQILGTPLREGFAEIWETIGPMQHAVLAGGDATWDEDLPLVIERGHGPEQHWFTFSYSHVPDAGGAGGVLTVIAMTTNEVVDRRRLALLNTVASTTAGADDVEAVCAAAIRLLGETPEEVAAAGVYVRDDDALRLVASTGASRPGGPRLPERIGPDDDDSYQLLAAGRGARRVQPLPTTPEDCAPRLVALHPLGDEVGDDHGGGVLLVAPDPLRPYDAASDAWYGLIADQLGAAIAAARARRTERERLEALAALQQLRSEFLSGISHEFRTPLTLLLGPLEDALRDGTAIADASELRSMHVNANRLLRLVDALLDVARGESGRLEASRTEVDVRALTADLAQAFAGAFEREGRTYVVALDDVGIVRLDPVLWERAVVNLLGNALKHAGEGGVTVGLRRDDQDVVLTVADTGPGIPTDQRRRVFERFERLPATHAASVEGSGIGLALVAETARLHDGTADVVETSGGGASFRLRVPAAIVHATDPVTSAVAADGRSSLAEIGVADTEQPSDLPGAELVDDGRPLVLVVDDNPELRRRIRRALGAAHRVAEAEDGRAALAVVEQAVPDLVLTDVMMPRLDGLGLTEALRASPATATVPIVVLTARTGPDAAGESLMAGADDHLTKPFNTAELQARVRATIELSRLRQETSATRARTELLAGVSHQLQSPLTMVLGAIDLLAREELEERDRTSILERAAARGAELRRLVLEFVDWANLSGGARLDVRAEAVELHRLVDELAATVDVAEVEVPTTTVLRTDPDRLGRALHTFVADARSRGAGTVRMRAALTAEHVAVAIDDDAPTAGDGRDDDTPLTPFAGTIGHRRTGLGPYVAAANVRALGGDVDVRRHAERTCVLVSIPLLGAQP